MFDQVDLRLYGQPEATAGIVIGFASLRGAVDHTVAVMQARPIPPKTF